MYYDGQDSATVNDQGQMVSRVRDMLGRVVRVQDAYNGQMAFIMDAFGNVLTVQDALQNKVTQQFDIRGNRVSLNDPDAGVWTYCHDPLGQLTAQQNNTMREAAGSTTTCPASTSNGTTAVAVAGWSTSAYDALGRLTSQVEPESVTTLSYDSCANGVGHLCKSSTSTGVIKTWQYDTLGRQSAMRTDAGNTSPSVVMNDSYDADTGRLVTHTFPTGLQVNYGYTGKGYVEKLSLATAANVTPLPNKAGGTASPAVTLPAGSVLWQTKAINAWAATNRRRRATAWWRPPPTRHPVVNQKARLPRWAARSCSTKAIPGMQNAT